MVEAKAVTWDVIDVDTQTASRAAPRASSRRSIGPSSASTSRSSSAAICSIAPFRTSSTTVIAYDTDKLNPGPTTIADCSISQKFPGKRGLQKNPFVNLEWALIADGVPIADVYKVLEHAGRRRSRVRQARHDQERSHLVGSRRPAAAAPRRGQVAMTRPGTAASTRRHRQGQEDLQDRLGPPGPGLGLVGDPQGHAEAWMRPTSSWPLRGSRRRMADQTKYISYGPANKDAIPNVDPAMLPHLPTAPDNMKTALNVDPQFWADKGEELRERFNAWLAQVSELRREEALPPPAFLHSG